MNETGVIPEFQGILVHDCWSRYFGYSCDHAVGNAHILRDLKGKSENTHQKWSDKMQSLLIEINAAVEEAPDSAEKLTQAQIIDYGEIFDLILNSGMEENISFLLPTKRQTRTEKKIEIREPY